MMTLSKNLIDELKSYPQRLSLPNAERLSIPDEEDEDDLDETILEKELPPISITDPLIPIPTQTDFSSKNSLTRSYRFVQLEHALTLANLLTTNDDRIKFEHDYLESLRENKFEEFLEISYQKIRHQKEKIQQERILKRSQLFTFVDLEKNFLALDPTRNIKIRFIDDPATSSSSKMTYAKNPALSVQSDIDAMVETFYENRSRRLLRNPSRVRDEITLFARHASERLHERLPHLSKVPHQVQIVDERGTKETLDEHTLLQLKHEKALSLIAKRRQLIMKMMIQTKINQMKMKKLNIQTPLIMNNSSSCRELLERINQTEQMIKEKHYQRSQAGSISRRTSSKTTTYSSTQTTTITDSITPSFSSCSTPFQDVLPTYHVEKANKHHIILPKRPFTAPIKNLTWINYC